MKRQASTLKALFLLAPLILVLLIPVAAFGQEPGERGVVEFGVRQFWGNVDGRTDLPFNPSLYASKLNEYRDISNGFFFRRADVLLQLGKSHLFHVQAQSGFLRDQGYLATLERPGRYRFQFRWDDTPHSFTNTAQFLFQETSPGLFTVPASLRSSLLAAAASPSFATVGATSVLNPLLANAPAFPVGLRRRTATVSATMFPTAAITLGFRISREKQQGRRPIGTYSPGFEFPEPIDYRTTLIQFNGEYIAERWGFQFGYLGSLFANKVDTLIWDNAFSATARGRIDLYPDNHAHSLSFAGAVDLGKSTRAMLSIVPGWMYQNDPFIPFSINAVTPSMPAAPASSLNGKKQTLAMNYTLVNHSIKHLELTARYRSYDYDNRTPSLFFPAYVLLDGARSDVLPGASQRMPRQSLPYEFNRKNVELAAVWEFLKKSTVKLGYEFERYNREHRDVKTSDENTFVASVDLNPNKLTLVRISYRHGDRSPNLYVDNTENFPLGVEPARQQLAEFRRFDEAARLRNRGEALIQFSPLQTVSFSATYGTVQDNYHKSAYGVIKDISYYYTFDLDYSPHPNVSFFTEYAREKYKLRQRSRLMCALGTGLCAGTNNSPNNDWESASRTLVDTWTLGTDLSLAEHKVAFSTFYSISASYGALHSRSLGDPTLPGYLLNASLPECRFGGCTPMDFPDMNYRLHSFVATLRFALPKDFSPRLDYRYERFSRIDWQIDRMRPYMFSVDPSSGSQIFLGADTPSYKGHVLSATLEYRF